MILDVSEAALAAMVQTLWERAHGTVGGKVRVLVGQDSAALLIERAFSPAEQEAARRTEGRDLVQRYAEQLMAAIQPDLRVQTEAITGRRFVSDSVHVDVATGHILCFFVLGEWLASPPTPNAESPP